MRPHRPSLAVSPWRRGITLLEVLLALAILGMALAAITNLTGQGATAAQRCEKDTAAVLHCTSQLDQLLMESQPIRETRWAPVEGTADWQWSVSVAPGPTPELQRVTMAVRRSAGESVACSITRLTRRSRYGGRRP